MYTGRKKISGYFFLTTALVVLLPILANAYQVNLTSFQSGYGSSGEIYGYLYGNTAESLAFGCMQQGTQVNVQGTYYAQNLALTGTEQLQAAWIFDQYSPTLNGAYGSYSFLQTGVAAQNAMWSVLGGTMNTTDATVLALANYMVGQVTAVDSTALLSVASGYYYVDLYSDINFTIPVQDLIRPVPIPAAAWLLGSGLIGLVALRRRSKK